MKRKNVLILLLIFLLLLSPTCVLLVRAIETSPFPEREKITEVEIRFETSGEEKAEGAPRETLPSDAPEIDLLYAVFRGAKRVLRHSLPDKYASYRLTFRGDESEEVLTLYVGAADFSVYVLTSGKRLYRLAMPTATHRNTVLPPSAASFSLDGREVVSRYDYPDYANGPTAIERISLSSWKIANDFVFDGRNVSVNYLLYAAGAEEPYKETTDRNEIVSLNPEKVRMDVTAELGEGLFVTLHYYLNVQK